MGDVDFAAAMGAAVLLAPGRGADEVVTTAEAEAVPLAHGLVEGEGSRVRGSVMG